MNEWVSGEKDKPFLRVGIQLINVKGMTEYFLNHCLVSPIAVTFTKESSIAAKICRWKFDEK